ncbi:DUF4118 domain-containing protein [Paracoccus kondratievae]|uniref:histidine kinase n=1 Tax=Paracoccus kondratievae TaxID=135740 RepID=A0AAD3NZW8_9RHOB|nr:MULTISPECIES: DUF4118 domain-containing protein [Paracoccus]QFQ89271.1 DUF4118 domain-containing protein [Paracoccus kondratievae]GLK65007.1 hypothetical protein GCM10017635_24780 [Paracoccus kondratievae]SMG54538.1 protein of unknown function [Paracoccus sp. J56]
MDKRPALAPDPAMESFEPPRLPPDDRRWMTTPRPGGVLGAALLLALVALAAGQLREFLPENVSILLFLTAVLINAAAFGFWVGIASALGAIAAFNFLFVEPHFTLHISRPHDLVTVAVFLLAASLTGLLAGRLREQVEAAKTRAAALEMLSQASAELAAVTGPAEVTRIVLRHLNRLSEGPAVALAPQGNGLHLIAALPEGYAPEPRELDAADIAFRHGRAELAPAQGWNGQRLSFYPLQVEGSPGPVLGHARLAPDRRDRDLRERTIEVMLRQAEQALHRLSLAQAAEAERRRAAAEETRAALLASLSHDLRTPLATILGAVTTLRELGVTLPPDSQADLLAAIEEEAERLARYVEKLLQLTRLNAGIAAQMTWVDAGDAAQAAVARARRAWPDAQILAETGDLPMIRAEAGLLEQSVFNLVENAVKYAPGPIRVTGTVDGDELVLAVLDHGPGLPPAVANWLGQDGLTGAPAGAGLGLPICKGIARTLGGRLTASRDGAGAKLALRLPIPEAAA